MLQTCRLRHDCPTAAHSCETGGLAITAHLNCHLFGALYLVDAMRQFWVLDEGLVGAIEDDDTLVLARVVHPHFQLLTRQHGAGGVIRETEIDEVSRLGWQFRHKAVVRVTRQEDDLAARHDTRVHVGWIRGV